MHMSTCEKKKIIKKMYKEGYSLEKISKKLNLGKSTVFYWYRKYKGPTIKKIEINETLEESIGEIVGAFAGDGNYYRGKRYSYRIRICLSGNELQYAEKLRDIIRSVYKNVLVRLYKCKNVFVVDVTRKEIIEHIKKYLLWDENRSLTIRLKNSPDNYSTQFLKGFCRGIVDTEGWVCKNNLMVASSSYRLIDDLSESLDILGINHMKTSWKQTNGNLNRRYVVFFNKKNTFDFKDKIGFSNIKRERKLVPPARFEIVKP